MVVPGKAKSEVYKSYERSRMLAGPTKVDWSRVSITYTAKGAIWPPSVGSTFDGAVYTECLHVTHHLFTLASPDVQQLHTYNRVLKCSLPLPSGTSDHMTLECFADENGGPWSSAQTSDSHFDSIEGLLIPRSAHTCSGRPWTHLLANLCRLSPNIDGEGHWPPVLGEQRRGTP